MKNATTITLSDMPNEKVYYYICSKANFTKVKAFNKETTLLAYLEKLLDSKFTTWEYFREWIAGAQDCGLAAISPYSGSIYIHTPEGLLRICDHWGQVAACQWPLDGKTVNVSKFRRDGKKPSNLFIGLRENGNYDYQGRVHIGFVKWEDIQCAPVEALNLPCYCRQLMIDLKWSNETGFPTEIHNVLSRHNLLNERGAICDFTTPAMSIPGLIEELKAALAGIWVREHS